MAASRKTGGTTSTLTVDAAATTLTSTTAVSGGEHFVLAVNTSALGDNQYLQVSIKVAIEGGSALDVAGSPFNVPAGQLANSDLFTVAGSEAYSCSVILRGGSTGRAIPWTLFGVDR